MTMDCFSMTRIGACHISGGIPCQDASCCGKHGAFSYAVTADGHGSRRHFRSDRGSKIACSVAKEAICAFLDADIGTAEDIDERLTALKNTICTGWREAVEEDHRGEPWSEPELAEVRDRLTEEAFARLSDGTDAAIAYGSTLCAVFTHPGGWAAIQLGDGAFTVINADGSYDWPMPESRVNQGNRTASLCMRDPMQDFRHCYGTALPAGMLIYTDGIEKVFPPRGRELLSFLHWIWRNEYAEEHVRDGNLARTLDTLTRRSPVGDDLSIAGLFDPKAEDAAPVLGRSQQLQELDRLQARFFELNSSADYTREMLRLGLQDGTLSEETREQMISVLQRNRDTASHLLEQIAALREAMSLEPLELPVSGDPPAAESASETEEALFPAESAELPEEGPEDAVQADSEPLPNTAEKMLERLRKFWNQL